MPAPLHWGLAAEHDLQVLAVEFACLSQGHDALPVARELLDVHFLDNGDRVRAGSACVFPPVTNFPHTPKASRATKPEMPANTSKH